jgi:hypothetical protein
MLDDQLREKFKADVSDMKLKTGKPRIESMLTPLSILLMLVGIVGGFVAYTISLNQADPRSVGSYDILATAFLALVIAGAAMLVTSRVSSLLRMWLLRQLYQGQAQTDQLTHALDSSAHNSSAHNSARTSDV